MERPIFRRILAYLIDIAVVSVIVFLFSKIEILNPNSEEYNKVYSEFETYVTENTKDTEDVTSILKSEEYNNYSYKLSKLQIPSSILNIVVTFGYFVIFQYFNKGQTIGKKFMKIRVKSTKGDKVSFVQMLVRSLLINEILSSIILVIFLSTMSQGMYSSAGKIVQLIDMIIVYGSIGFILFRKDARGLHDLLVSTCVVEEDAEESENVNEEVVIEETIKPEKVTKTKKVREANVSENKTHKSVKKNVKKDE